MISTLKSNVDFRIVGIGTLGVLFRSSAGFVYLVKALVAVFKNPATPISGLSGICQGMRLLPTHL